jgi:hypothetical protein
MLEAATDASALTLFNLFRQSHRDARAAASNSIAYWSGYAGQIQWRVHNLLAKANGEGWHHFPQYREANRSVKHFIQEMSSSSPEFTGRLHALITPERLEADVSNYEKHLRQWPKIAAVISGVRPPE